MNIFIRLLGDRVRKLRKNQKLSQEKLGKKAGFDYRYIGFIEQARVNPTIKTLGKIANALNIPLCELCPTKEELLKYKKPVSGQASEREKVLYKIVRNLNAVSTNKLKSIERIVKITVETDD
jgi:transcriptional regulator with XRE-family HTH domain